jgi:hypothetical protein
MKPQLFLFTALLSLLPSAITHAQTAPLPVLEKNPASTELPPTASTPPPAPALSWKVDLNGDDTLYLKEGTLPEVVAQVERSVATMIGPDGKTGQMPNIVYGPGTQSVRVPAELRLRQVSPVQALALVAAAAGCKLDPIEAPDTVLSGDPAIPGDPFASRPSARQIIGYRLMMTPEGGMAPVTRYPQLHKTKDSAEPNNLRGSGTARPSAGFGTASSGLGPIKVVEPATNFPNPKQGGFAQTSGPFTANEAPPIFPEPKGTQAAEDSTVRIYALGAVLRGEPKEMEEKQKAVQNLVAEALERGALGGDRPPLLSFHTATRALIVKGSASQHEIIQQIIAAMKENALSESGASGGSGGLELGK